MPSAPFLCATVSVLPSSALKRSASNSMPSRRAMGSAAAADQHLNQFLEITLSG
jgi:hypothetical protein